MANLNLSQFTEKTLVADADWVFVWDTAGSISKKVSRNSLLSGTTADFHLGLADAAAPVAQTLSVQSVVAGTTNTAGANFTINGSQGTGTGAGGSLLFRTAPAGSSGTTQNALGTALAITAAGNVGIGTTAPAEKLHVLGGKVLFGDPADTTGTAGNGDLTLQAWRAPQLNMVANSSSSAPFGLNLKSGATTLAGMTLNIGSGEVKIGGFFTGGYFPTFYSNNAEIMRISTAGNVGIGTTAPSSKLHVAETWNAPTVAVTSATGTGTVATVNFASSAVIPVGTSVTVTGVSPAGYNGTYVVTVSSATSVSYANTTTTSATAGGTVQRVFAAMQVVATDTASATASDFLELYSGTSTQPLRLDINKTGQINSYGAWTDANNYERLSISGGAASNAIIGTNKAGTGVARGLEFQTDGVTKLSISGSAPFLGTFGSASNAQWLELSANAGTTLQYNSTHKIYFSSTACEITANNTTITTGLVRFSGVTSSFPALKRSTTSLQAVLANDSGFTNIQGKLTTDTDYTATTIVPTGFLTLYDAQGTAYRVPCVAA